MNVEMALVAPVGKPLNHDIPAQLFRLDHIRELKLTNCAGFSWNTELSHKPRCRIVNPFKGYKLTYRIALNKRVLIQ